MPDSCEDAALHTMQLLNGSKTNLDGNNMKKNNCKCPSTFCKKNMAIPLYDISRLVAGDLHQHLNHVLMQSVMEKIYIFIQIYH